MPETSYFFDTVSLSNFAMSGALPLLVQRYGTAATVPNEVLDELIAGTAAGHAALQHVVDLVNQGVFASTALTKVERQVLAETISHLGQGEASCIAAATKRGGTVVTDDRAARNACSERKVPVTGTIGILKAACIEGQVSVEEADRILTAMVRYGFYSPVHRIRDIL